MTSPPEGDGLRRPGPDGLAWRTLGRLGVIGRLDRTARRLGLARVDGRSLRRPVWVGEVGGSRVELRVAMEGETRFGLRLDLRRAVHGVESVLLARRGSHLAMSGHSGLAACIDPTLTARLRAGDAVGFSPQGAHFSSSRRSAAREVSRWRHDLEGLVLLLDGAQLPALLLARASDRSSPPKDRAAAARALFEHYGDADEARIGLARLRDEPAWSIRLATLLPLRGSSAVRAARGLADRAEAPLPARVEAIGRLAHLVDLPETAGALGDLARDDEPAIRAAAIRGATALGDRGLGIVARALADTAPEVRLAVAEALGMIGGSKAERSLIRILESTGTDAPSVAVGRTAAASLGRIGTIASIATLARCSEGAGWSAPLVDVVLAAIEQIRRRMPPGERGLLGVAADGGGLGEPP